MRQLSIEVFATSAVLSRPGIDARSCAEQICIGAPNQLDHQCERILVSAFWLATMSFENDALDGSKVSLNGFCICAAATERSRRMFDLGFISCDQEVVAFFFAQRLAVPMPVDAPVTMAKGREAGIVASTAIRSSSRRFPWSFQQR
jgi:hypothetical protein